MCWPRRRNRRKERILDAGLPAPGQTGQGEHAQAVTLPDLELENQASQRQASPELNNVESGTSESGLNPVGLSSAEAYKYDPLPDQRLYIRLLEVLPTERDDDLRCYLCVTPLDALPSFEALSYVWGDASTRSTILCHGRPMSISQSLDKALRRFRLEAKSRIIWADAICINQEDFEERGNQVLLMRDIYQTAARVLVWLGSDDRLQASGVFKFAKFVSDLASDASLDDTVINASIERDWPSERDIFSRDALVIPWFRRVWILQEVGLSSDALMTWGDAEIHWDIWARVCNYLAGCKEGWGAELTFSASLNGISTVSSIGLLNFKHGDQMHVGKVLHLARNFRSTYAHDKVYGLLGHPAFRTFCRSQGLDTFIQVDYSGTPFDVYRSVAMLFATA
ncbi:hypothetical protein ONZ45_g15264 [Pleurotus djamor]|nr:hypothetical protein ONZ45_g15264 [Pleurotus djamor]